MVTLPDVHVEAVNIPATIDTEWTLSSSESYDGGTCVLSGNLTVTSGNTLTLDNVTIAINNQFDGQYKITVESNGALILRNSVIKSNTVNRTENLTSDGIISATNSTFERIGFVGWDDWDYGIRRGVIVNGGTASFINTTFQYNDIGLITMNTAPTLQGCLFENNNYMGVVFSGNHPIISDLEVKNNCPANDCGSLSIATGVMARDGASFEIHNSSLVNNKFRGILVIDSDVYVFNSSITANSQNTDIDARTRNAMLNVTNTTIGYSRGFGSSGFAPILNVHWHLDVEALWESDGSPVREGGLQIENDKGSRVYEDQLDHDGMKRWIRLREYTQTIASEKEMDTPHTITVNGTRDGNLRSAVGSKQLHSNENITLVLDDVPPIINITSPLDGYITNETNLTVWGVTEPGAMVYVNGQKATVYANGTYKVDIILYDEGTNIITATAWDDVENEATFVMDVELDTIAPSLAIGSPVDGAIFNHTTILVEGTAEAGNIVTVNGQEVPVGVYGKFNATLELDEGVHEIVAVGTDAAGNSVMDSVSIEIDLRPPILLVSNPYDGIWTNEASIFVDGTTEAMAKVTMNGKAVVQTATSFRGQVDLIEGINEINVVSCDVAGNCNSTTIYVMRDTTPPSLYITNPPDEDYVITNLSAFLIEGETDPGSSVFIGKDTVDVDDDGMFQVSVELDEGINIFEVTSEDWLGNSVTLERKVKRDTKPPMVGVIEPEDGLVTREQEIRIRGMSETGAKVTIDGVRVGSLTGMGFDSIVTLPKEGLNQFTIVATDHAGNQNTIYLNVTRDTQIDLYIISPSNKTRTKEDSVTVRGVTDPKATVMIGEAVLNASEDGSFSLEVNLDLGENTIKVKVVDAVGNDKEEELTVIRDTVRTIAPETGFSLGLWLLLIALVVIVIVLLSIKILRGRGQEGPDFEMTEEDVEEEGEDAT
jgi:hypothetical protein